MSRARSGRVSPVGGGRECLSLGGTMPVAAARGMVTSGALKTYDGGLFFIGVQPADAVSVNYHPRARTWQAQGTISPIKIRIWDRRC